MPGLLWRRTCLDRSVVRRRASDLEAGDRPVEDVLLAEEQVLTSLDHLGEIKRFLWIVGEPELNWGRCLLPMFDRQPYQRSAIWMILSSQMYNTPMFSSNDPNDQVHGNLRGGVKKLFFLLLVKKFGPPPLFLTTSVFSDEDFLDWPRPPPPQGQRWKILESFDPEICNFSPKWRLWRQ